MHQVPSWLFTEVTLHSKKTSSASAERGEHDEAVDDGWMDVVAVITDHTTDP